MAYSNLFILKFWVLEIIYIGDYEGYYCTSEESYIPKNEVNEKENGKKVIFSYFSIVKKVMKFRF